MDKEDIVHIYNGKLLSHKKNVVMPFAATCIDIDNIILSEVSQSKTKYMISHICVTQKRDTSEFIHKRQKDCIQLLYS